MADLKGFDAPEPGEVLLVSCGADGAVGWMKMPHYVFAELGQRSPWTRRPADGADGQPFTGASLLRMIDQSMDRLREKARA